METIDLKMVSVQLRDDGIMHVHIKEGADMGISDAIQVVKAMGKLGNQKKFPVLLDCGEFATVDKEAREFWAKKKANIYTNADALAYNSFAHRMVADFYINNNKPEVPTQVFPDSESAIIWLKTIQPKQIK